MTISLSMSPSTRRGEGKWLGTHEILDLLLKILILIAIVQVSNFKVVNDRGFQNFLDETHAQPTSCLPINKDKSESGVASTMKRIGSDIGIEGKATGRTIPVDHNMTTLNPPTTENTIVVAIHMQRSTKMPLRLVCSVRGPGRWRGPMMLITDTEESVATYEQSFKEYCGPVFVKQGKPEDLVPTNSTNHSIQYRRPRSMRAKRFKTLLWEYADSEPSLRNIEYIVYFDVDIIIAGHLEDFLEESFARMAVSTGLANADASKMHTTYPISSIDLSETKSFISVIPQTFNHLAGQMHTGVMIYHRHFSQYCLSWWQNQFDTEGKIQVQDQVLLMNAPNITNNRCTFHKLSHDWMLFPTVPDMKAKRRKSIVHFTSLRASRGSSELQQQYLLDIFGWDETTPQLLAVFGNKSASLTNKGLKE